jgi:hypothetical protein
LQEILHTNFIQFLAGVSYIIDKNYKIIDYSRESWNKFASDNDSETLLIEDKVLNKNVLDFFSGNSMKTTYKMIFDEIINRNLGSFQLEYHCDSKYFERTGYLFITPLFSERGRINNLLVQSVIIKERPRKTLNFEFIWNKIVSENIITVCSFCHRVKTEDDMVEWITIQDFSVIVKDTSNIQISHGLCDSCQNQIYKQFTQGNFQDNLN